ncbi:MAG: methionyl-tRNA formyltransferase [Treponema sp.]|jgi:methionyl-tRNA formyltransferase|nr:methionyl-tRNA formyltransferase [Treponema sp.]
MRVLFAGSPAIAVPSLEALAGLEGITLAAVLTNQDTPKGRHGEAFPTEVGAFAQKLMVSSILKPDKLDKETREQITLLNCDILVSFAYGRIFGPKFLEMFALGGINIHPSLLPKYRGPTPIQAAILNRDTETGITIQKLAKEMDSGDILLQEKLPLSGKETTFSLSEIAAQKAAKMLTKVIKQYDTIQGIEQNHTQATYCPLICKDDGIINWKCSVMEIEAKIRAFTPWPLCWTIHNERKLTILKSDVFYGNIDSKVHLPGYVLGIDKNNGILIQTGDGILAVTELQYQGKKALFWRDFLNGARDFTGSQLAG